jgi:hypothetical protein
LPAEVGTVGIISTAIAEPMRKMTRAISRMSMGHIVDKMWTTISCDWENSPLTPEAQSAVRKFLGTIVQLIELVIIFRPKISSKKS